MPRPTNKSLINKSVVIRTRVSPVERTVIHAHFNAQKEKRSASECVRGLILSDMERKAVEMNITLMEYIKILKTLAPELLSEHNAKYADKTKRGKKIKSRKDKSTQCQPIER